LEEIENPHDVIMWNEDMEAMEKLLAGVNDDTTKSI
jgi:hypothetical protein